MPEPTPPRRPRASSRPHPGLLPRAEPPEQAPSPRWARAVHVFYDPIFDIRSRAAFQDALNDYVTLPERERAFHDTHLLFRLVQGLESVHGLLERIDQKLTLVASPDLTALEHLGPIRAALEEISSTQPSLVSVDGFDEDVEEDDGQEDDEPPEDDELAEDPDFIYDTIPDLEPERPRPSRRASEPPRPPPERPSPRPADPEREALIGELVPATEGPDAEPGER